MVSEINESFNYSKKPKKRLAARKKLSVSIKISAFCLSNNQQLEAKLHEFFKTESFKLQERTEKLSADVS